ncbi:carbohydrate ABC transporter permease [Paenibacillus piri]|uniref:Sugar ABC transporter permease n=1 Tax=Paenibacillus piri TaxID=2547395 RepID=A0A4V2ZTZ3_9BACL|nr:sugar ABC transporter permease [Paenibacillus piri]TDF98664.1 sugar ABC transporter permease [Paenibacillus piri]
MPLKMLLRKNHFSDPVAYLLIAPFYLMFLYFIFIPALEVIVYSFTDFNLFEQKHFIGLNNYVKLLKDDVFLKSIQNTLIYLLFTIVPMMALGMLAAVVMNIKWVNTKVARTFIFTPYIVSMVAVSMVWMLLYDPSHGIFNRILIALGMSPKEWLIDPQWSLFSIVLMSIWKGVGYNMIIFLAGLQGIPRDLYEAADVDGAGKWHQFIHITVPMLAPATFFLFVTGIIASFNVFEQVNVMTAGGPVNSTTTIVHQIYLRAFTEFKMGYASAQSVVLLLGVLLITVLNMKFGASKHKK